MTATTAARPRMSAPDRRDAVISAALTEFANGGLDGTSTDAIASRAGISQPYLFRLFGTKKNLFIACCARIHERILEAFDQAAAEFEKGRAPASADSCLLAMGAAYSKLVGTDRELLLGQLQAFAASGKDEEIRAGMSQQFRDLQRFVEQRSGATREEVRDFSARGMLITVAAALDAPELADTESLTRVLRSKRKASS